MNDAEIFANGIYLLDNIVNVSEDIIRKRLKVLYTPTKPKL